MKTIKKQLIERVTNLERHVTPLQSNLNLGNNRDAGQVNKIYLIKMIRSAQRQFNLDLADGKISTGEGCMGLAESKRFVENYLEENLQPQLIMENEADTVPQS